MIRRMKLCLLAVVVLLSVAVRGEDDSDVIELDASNFAEGVDKDIILVEFYAPW